jgi:hypothetical protein
MTDSPAPERHPGDTIWGHVAHVLRDNPVTLLAFGMVAFLVGCALFGPSLVPMIRWPPMPPGRWSRPAGTIGSAPTIWAATSSAG